jgi:DNA repair photolyase
MRQLCQRFGKEAVSWRFDPIVFYTVGSSPQENNLKNFLTIADAAASAGIHRCITSFLDMYAKVKRRVAKRPGLVLVDPSDAEKVRILVRMQNALSARKISLYTCCETALLAKLPENTVISASGCISHRLLTELFGGGLSRRPDRGQRVKQGCGCGASVDIGSYAKHPCYHDCLFCYANPSPSRLNPA